MSVIRVTKMFNFEMAHALLNYDGPCKHIHGHSYKLFVTLTGTPISDKNDVKQGMVIDFGDLKTIVRDTIVDVFDHALVLNSDAKAMFCEKDHEMFGQVIYVNYQPTCENLAADFARRIKSLIPKNTNLFSIRLYETSTSYAEWFASDNLS